MADYLPLISRAVNGLDKSTGEIRRALYERARAALVAQLRSVEPVLDESDITRERLALEDAIRKVEADAVRRMRPEAAAATATAPDRGLRGLRDTVADAEGLGDAAAAANRSAHELYDAMPGGHGQPPAEHYFEPPSGAEPLHGAPFADGEGSPAQAEALAHSPPSFEPEEQVYRRPVRSYGRAIRFVLLLLVLAGLAGGAYWQRHAIMSMVASFRSTPAPEPQAATPTSKPKIPDRVGAAGGTTAPVNAPAAAVAQKVVLYDEDPNDPKGKRFVGSALWRTETVSPGPGLAPELAIRADVEIPERHMRMTWSLRRNTDKALPASHTIEIMFTLPADFPEGGIGNVPGVLMKQDEQARGVPLAGLAVKVTNGYFLIGLSAVDVDVQRNIELLKERDWFDIPIVYTSGKRAIMALEKGTPGVRAFEEAFRAWGQ